MDTLDELLNEEISAMSYTDDELIVNADDRTIYIPNTLAGVTSDEKSTRLKFRCPKSVGDNVDLSAMNVYINFRNANGDIYSYLTDDVTVDGTDITFSWLLSRDVTTYKGNINFIVCAKKIQSDGKITIEWNTTLATLTVLEGLEPDDSYIPTEKVDVATELMNAVNTLKNELNGVKDSIKDFIPDEYITEAELNAHTSNNDVHVTTADRSKWNGKFDSNQGTSNAGKLLGTNSNGDVVAIQGYGFEYDETTKMLKYGTDPTTNLNQGIGLDDTLSKKGYAAEASSVGELKSDIVELEEAIAPYNINKFTSVKNGYQLSNNGAEIANESAPYYFITSKMFIKSGDYVLFGKNGNYNCNKVVYYTDNAEITQFTTGGTVINDTRYDTTDTVKARKITISVDGYIAICFYTGYRSITPNKDNIAIVNENVYKKNLFLPISTFIVTDKLYIDDKKWLSGKLWYALGDSLTAQNQYTSYVTDATGAICTNYGVGGSPLCDYDGSHSDAMVYRYNQMSETNPDFITVMGGTNDCYYAPVGTVGDKVNNTVAGAIYTIYKGLQEKYPNVPILWCIFPRRMDSKWSDYYNIIKDTLEYWSIPYVDVYKNCGFNDWNKTTYFNSNDEVHINSNGGKVVGKLIVDALHKVLDY